MGFYKNALSVRLSVVRALTFEYFSMRFFECYLNRSREALPVNGAKRVRGSGLDYSVCMVYFTLWWDFAVFAILFN